MTFAALIADVIRRLEAAAIPYMITGSVASSYYGEPRATRDLDVVIAPDASSLEDLVAGLTADGYYVDRDAARDAFRGRSQFNAIGSDALKVDFIIRKDRPFSVREFERRRPVYLLGNQSFVASVEDLIVAKLEWAATGPSELQLRDVAGILAISGDEIDRNYVSAWISALRLEDVWSKVAT